MAAALVLCLCSIAGAQDADASAANPDALSIEHPIQTHTSAEPWLFGLFGGAALVSAIGVVISTNIVRTATWLMGNVIAIACLYFLLGANFVGAVQLIVYAGGILILIVFGVMLTNRLPAAKLIPTRGEILGGACVCLALGICLIGVLTLTAWPDANPAGSAFTIERIGKALLSDYLVPFEVASMLLLVVMVGAAYLVRAKK